MRGKYPTRPTCRRLVLLHNALLALWVALPVVILALAALRWWPGVLAGLALGVALERTCARLRQVAGADDRARR